jgi:hypothetical protein
LFAYIKGERDNVVKEYELSAGHGATTGLRSSKRLPESHKNHYLIHSGPYAGRDQRDVLREAITLLEAHVDAIDAAVAAS